MPYSEKCQFNHIARDPNIKLGLSKPRKSNNTNKYWTYTWIVYTLRGSRNFENPQFREGEGQFKSVNKSLSW